MTLYTQVVRLKDGHIFNSRTRRWVKPTPTNWAKCAKTKRRQAKP